MPDRRIDRSLLVLYVTTGAVLLYASLATLVGALEPGRHAIDRHVVLLAGLEAVAAALFLVPRTMRAGASLLLGLFAVALAFHAVHGEFAVQLLVYAAAVLFVRAHGVDRGGGA